MKKLFIIILLLSISILSYSRIGYIQPNGYWYEIYNENGKRIDKMATSNGSLVGYSSQYYILCDGYWYVIYNENGKRITKVSVSNVGTILNVQSDGFVSQKNGWIYYWAPNGKLIKKSSSY